MLNDKEDEEGAVASAKALPLSSLSNIKVVVLSNKEEVDKSKASDSKDFIATSDKEELRDSNRVNDDSKGK
jgi:hypothetical protein